MFKNLLLSFAGIGGIAVVPFSLLFSKGESTSLYSDKSLLVDSPQGGGVGPVSKPSSESIKVIDSNSLPTRGGRHLQEQVLGDSSGSSDFFQTQRVNVLTSSPLKENPQLSNTPKIFVSQSQTIKTQETDLTRWLSTISPLLKGEGANKPLTIIGKWNHKYFIIIRWDPTCQCFRKVDNDYGIWSNRDGLFIIAHKWANEQTKRNSIIVDKPQCKNFNDFWYQDWHNYWKLGSWLKTMNIDKDSNTAIASCNKEPVIFLDTGVIVPTFESETRRAIPKYMEKASNREIAWDYNTKTFASSYNNYGGSSNIFKVNSYEDWKKFFNLVEIERK
ncbi:hypothetical protein DNK47_02800 [Mycoplasma wenyonii]|uniref:Uncharacterized protein n=1 Tax=Mycoplasma wenyonii TaxID=65123 RepID=A0A328PJ83_9MOLU|nr:hypothetical protein [Mycoplasma wenyonii]RAO94872.1 hypothetical protein DNK47_02800 [Mycoplasma wenyonii]